MSIQDKIKYFEYFLDKTHNYLNLDSFNDLSIVKVQKLIFFLTNSVEENDKYPLLKTFNKFYALPYGHVESDIYEAIKNKSELQCFEINRFCTNKKRKLQIEKDITTNLIDKGFDNLVNYGLIKKPASYLVDLSHCHESWIKNYRAALSENKNSKLIPEEDLENETKFFSL